MYLGKWLSVTQSSDTIGKLPVTVKTLSHRIIMVTYITTRRIFGYCIVIQNYTTWDLPLKQYIVHHNMGT